MEKKTIISLFKNLLYIRLVEEKICELYPEQEMRCPVHLCIGQEAIAVALCENLEKKDLVFSNHRCHGHYLAKGGDLNEFFAEIYGKVTGCSKGRGGSMHLIDLNVNFMGSTPIVGGIIPVAVGAAFTQSYKKTNKIVVVFFGDAATEEGVFYESLNFAKLKNLPVLFVCENNLYSVYTPISLRQPKRRITKLVAAHGIPSYFEEGNNVIKAYELSKKVLGSIRKGNGPVFIEFSTYRYLEHCGPYDDINLGYRNIEELNEWKAKDPLKIIEKDILESNLLSKNEINQIKEQIQKEINNAVKFAKSSSFPAESELNKYIYANKND